MWFVFVILLVPVNFCCLYPQAGSSSNDQLYPVVINDKLGYINAEGNLVIPARHDYDFESDFITYGGLKLKNVIFPDYNYFRDHEATIQEDRYIVFKFLRLATKYWKIDTLGRKISETDPEKFIYYDKENDFVLVKNYSRILGVYVDESYIYLDGNYSAPISREYDWLGGYQCGYALALDKDRGYGFIDRSGKEAIEFIFDDATHFSEGRAGVKLGDKWGFIDTTGKWIIEPRFDRVWEFRNGSARIYEDEKFSFIDSSGKNIGHDSFDDAGDFSEGLACCKKGNLYGYIDTSGKPVIDMQYTNAGSFLNGRAAVEMNGKWAFIDRNNMPVTDFVFQYAINFMGDIARVWMDNTAYYINLNNNTLFRIFD